MCIRTPVYFSNVSKLYVTNVFLQHRYSIGVLFNADSNIAKAARRKLNLILYY